ncbi:MAG: response regulator [Pseudanabaena sp. RU_4_16]|nr:response regulator [Pseudanabaena sp. RU_4_16]NKB18764.1 response regulator [Pseudanabaena sp. CRU_2_10]
MTTIMIVDDSAMIREMVCEHLKQQGLAVVEAFDGADAIEKVKVSLPDLVVTDVVMPNKNGYELCRWLKNDPKAQSIPVIMCTTKSEEFDKYWGLKQGADAYVTKPYNPDELLNAIKQLLAKVKG